MCYSCDFEDGPILLLLFIAEKIKDLLPDGSLSSSTKLVAVNVVYFKGQWDREFEKENTKEEEFWLNKVWPLISLCGMLMHRM